MFRCVHDAHRDFKSDISPFYILTEKHCYPHGCVYFKWKCRLLAKQKSCFRGFQHVGKKCFNCRYFYEEKEHFHPLYIYSEKNSTQFTLEFEDFQEWIDQLRKKRVPCEGRVAAVLPDLALNREKSGIRLQMHGFLIRLVDGFIDNLPFSDAYYLFISALSQNKLKFRKDDLVEFEANLTIDRGRFRFIKPGRFQFYQRGTEKPLTKADILVSLKSYSLQKGQPAKCLRCDFGLLTDLLSAQPGPSRVLVCLQGVQDFQSCLQYSLASTEVEENACINEDWGKRNCHHVLR